MKEWELSLTISGKPVELGYVSAVTDEVRTWGCCLNGSDLLNHHPADCFETEFSAMLAFMTAKLLTIISVIAVAGLQAQSPTPSASRSPTKYRTREKAAATATPSSGGHPFSAWPKAKHAQKRGKSTKGASPTASESPAKH